MDGDNIFNVTIAVKSVMCLLCVCRREV